MLKYTQVINSCNLTHPQTELCVNMYDYLPQFFEHNRYSYVNIVKVICLPEATHREGMYGWC
jgi:hypothetical protein